MLKIGLISDTHGELPEDVVNQLRECDEIWHAGDIGSVALLDQMRNLGKMIRAVFGNIDGADLRLDVPAQLEWTLEGLKFFMTHIGGYPGHYAKGIKALLLEKVPDVFICGHSHILKVIFDKELNLLHLNPGACGRYGFHQVRTMLRFSIHSGKIADMAVIEFGRKGRRAEGRKGDQ